MPLAGAGPGKPVSSCCNQRCKSPDALSSNASSSLDCLAWGGRGGGTGHCTATAEGCESRLQPGNHASVSASPQANHFDLCFECIGIPFCCNLHPLCLALVQRFGSGGLDLHGRTLGGDLLAQGAGLVVPIPAPHAKSGQHANYRK